MQLSSHDYAIKMRANDKKLTSPPKITQPNDQAQDVAKYISSLLKHLSAMSRNAELSLLTYLLDMARLEAENQLKD